MIECISRIIKGSLGSYSDPDVKDGRKLTDSPLACDVAKSI